MGRNNKVRKFAAMKRTIKANDSRLTKSQSGKFKKKQGKTRTPRFFLTFFPGLKKKAPDGKIIERQLPKVSTAMFFKYNEQLGPPYHVLVDTNFINFTIKNRLVIHQECDHFFSSYFLVFSTG